MREIQVCHRVKPSLTTLNLRTQLRIQVIIIKMTKASKYKAKWIKDKPTDKQLTNICLEQQETPFQSQFIPDKQ